MAPGDSFAGWLVAGLGNPGKRYDGTRHNVGFDVLDRLAERWNVQGGSRRFHGWFAIARPDEIPGAVLLLKPMTYMNLSGRAVQGAMAFHRVLPARTIVVHDDMDLDAGVVRVKVGGGTAGHRGLESIAAAVGPGFVRVRVGIGRRGERDGADYVLSPFDADERRALEGALPLAIDALVAVMTVGPAAAMNAFHGRTRNRSGPNGDGDDPSEPPARPPKPTT